MFALLTNKSDSFVQFIVVLVIFVFVLGITAFVTKWIADYQKSQGVYGNIELLEATHLGNNKYIQLVRIGNRYIALAVCKDTVTMLGEVSKDELKQATTMQRTNFKDLLDKVVKNKVSTSDHFKE